MNIGRRDFMRGGAAFFVAAGLGGSAFGKDAGPARLRVGILSDIHIVDKDGTRENCAAIDMFEKALRHFRDSGADAVLIAGDMADGGLANELLAVGDAWRRVFPEGRRPDGAKVEKVFVTGNHDIDGWRYENARRKLKTAEEQHARAIGWKRNRAKVWKEAFDEEYVPIFIKDVKGYKFVGAHYNEFSKPGAVAAFLESHRAELAGRKPFFYTQHFHPRATCSAPWTWGQDCGESTAALRAFPNAVAFTGHSHTPLTDDRTLWRGEFTSVGTGSLKYLIPFGGRENSRIFGAKDVGTQQMPYLRCADGHHGQMMTVYDDRIVLERLDFENGLPAGPDWVVPLPAAAASFEERAGEAPVPQFPAGAKASVAEIRDVPERHGPWRRRARVRLRGARRGAGRRPREDMDDEARLFAALLLGAGAGRQDGDVPLRALGAACAQWQAGDGARRRMPLRGVAGELVRAARGPDQRGGPEQMTDAARLQTDADLCYNVRSCHAKHF